MGEEAKSENEGRASGARYLVDQLSLRARCQLWVSSGPPLRTQPYPRPSRPRYPAPIPSRSEGHAGGMLSA